jgi:hypothetical protein
MSPQLTATELKRWLYRYISEYAGTHEDYAGQVSGDQHYSRSAEALDRLANHVQHLPDDDERLVRLAAAFPKHWSLDNFPVGGNLQARCAGFGPGLWAGNDPDQFISDYVETEIPMAEGLPRPREEPDP